MKLAAPTQIAGLALHVVPVSEKTTWLFLEMRVSDQLRGWGEVTSFGNETSIGAEFSRLRDALVGKPAGELPALLAQLSGRSVSRARRIVNNGLEQAWLDIQARGAGISVAQQLGGTFRPDVPVYANINRGIAATRSPQDFASRAREAAGLGYRALKVAPFDGLDWRQGGTEAARRRDRGVERILAVRAAVGPDVEIMIDCHGRFDPALATGLIDAVAEARPYWLEDLLDPVFGADDPCRMRRRAHRHGIRIAGGEHIATMTEMLHFLHAGGTDVVLPDLRLTGIRHGMAICEAVAASGQHVSLHNPVGPVLDAFSRHAAAAMPDFLILERAVMESPLWQELRAGDVTLSKGRAALESGRGIGFDPEPRLLKPFTPETLPNRASFRNLPGAGADA